LTYSGAKQPFEAIFVSPKASNNKPSAGETKSLDDIPPLVLVLHGGPHAVTQTSFSRTAAFLSALGFNLLHVNYRYLEQHATVFMLMLIDMKLGTLSTLCSCCSMNELSDSFFWWIGMGKFVGI
jgi:hypothetical protein